MSQPAIDNLRSDAPGLPWAEQDARDRRARLTELLARVSREAAEGENLEAAALRELREETGYGADEWRYLGVMHPCVGYSNERIEIFLARGLRLDAGGQQLDHGELLDLLTLSLDDAVQAVRNGEITDAKTITALFWAEKILRSGW